MTIRRLVQSASITGVALFMMAASASASPIAYNTNGSAFGVGGTTLFSTFGSAVATLAWAPTSDSAAVPSGINYGTFTLACSGCTTQAGGTGAAFGPFTFNLIISDTTDSAQGTFLGTALAGTAYRDSTTLVINWAPLQLGAGTGAWTGNFGSTIFRTTNPTQIVDPTSGMADGRTTVQGTISSNAIPEPMTFVLIGTGLVGLGLLRRRTRKS